MIERILPLIVVGVICASVIGDVELIEFTEKTEWEGAVESFETIDFTGSEHGEYIGGHYLDSHGVMFTNAYNWNLPNTYENDGWGFINNVFAGGTWVEFNDPKLWIAADHPGVIQFDLYLNGELLASSSPFVGGGSTGNFSGLLSSHPFDRVYFYKPEPFQNTVSIDDLHFGAPIPATGALGIIVLGSLWLPRRRRH